MEKGTNMNYFRLLCFIWAFIGIASRIMMGIMGPKWKEWELGSAYKIKKPMFINVIGILGVFVVLVTWYMVFTLKDEYSWVIAGLISLIMIKVGTILLKYDAFRAFAVKTLYDKKKMSVLNGVVLIYSIVLITMGVYLY